MCKIQGGIPLSSVFSLLEQLVSTGALSFIFVRWCVGVDLTGWAGVLMEVLSIDTLSNGSCPTVLEWWLRPCLPPALGGSWLHLLTSVALLGHTLVGRSWPSFMSDNLVTLDQSSPRLRSAKVSGITWDLLSSESRQTRCVLSGWPGHCWTGLLLRRRTAL